MSVLEAVDFHIRDITEVPSTVIWGNRPELLLDPKSRKPMSDCLQTLASVMSCWNEDTADQEIFDQARAALDPLTSELKRSACEEEHCLTFDAAVAFDCERILHALRRRIIKAAAPRPH